MEFNMDALYAMKKNFTFTDEKTNEISFPLGGIGSGCIGLAGNGRLIDWEIFNKPNKNGSVNGFSFFALKADYNGKNIMAKVLQGDLHPPFTGNGHSDWAYGFGVKREYMTGLPHFKSTEFKGEFPIAEIKFMDDEVNLDVRLKAFNPFIPQNDLDSSLPCAIFTFEIRNNYDVDLDISLVGNLSNPFQKGAVNEFFATDSFRGMKLYSNYYSDNDPAFGDITISTDGDDISYQNYWYRGAWFDNLTVFWNDFVSEGKFKNRQYSSANDSESWNATVNFQDVALICNHKHIKSKETAEFKFVISWNFPNFFNYWNPCICDKSIPPNIQWKNFYATVFQNSIHSAQYVWENMMRLYKYTELFKKTLFQTSMPDYVIEAIASNLSTLKSPTCVRLTDGTLYGFEGCNVQSGCCEGSCTHVWNYAQATAFLFPALERSMRDVDYRVNQLENGKMVFRMLLPPGRERSISAIDPIAEHGKAAVDGQMGGIIKTFREWKINGDTKWLLKIWPKVKKALEFAWEASNEEWWDLDCDGVIEGIQHHTLDVEMFGPNSYLTGYYLTALLCAAKMADALGDEDGEKYRSLFDNGRTWVNDNLFNGDYFYQKIDLKDKRFPIDQELGQIKYQIGEGCHIDQVIGQWYAHIVGVGYIFDREKVKKSLSSIYNYNFKHCMRDFANTYRVYALNDEKGLVICTWPRANSPMVPIPYSGECMNGFEYQAACHMIYEGLLNEGLSVVKAVRERYDGKRRNPWNEFECGSNYARSLASYALLLALSGFEYDMVTGYIGFSPKINVETFDCFWSVGQAWGSFHVDANRITFSVLYGNIEIGSFFYNSVNSSVNKIKIDENAVNFCMKDNVIKFKSKINLLEKQLMEIFLN